MDKLGGGGRVYGIIELGLGSDGDVDGVQFVGVG